MILVSAATAAWAPLIRVGRPGLGGGVTNLYPGPAHLLNGFHRSTRSGSGTGTARVWRAQAGDR